MTSKRFFFVMLGAVGILVLLFGGGVYLSNKLLKSESNKLVELKLKDEVLDRRQEDLNRAKRDIDQYSELEAISKSIVPQDKDQAETIVEITNLAKQAGIQLGSIEFPQSQLGQITKNAKGKAAQPSDSSKTQLTELPDMKGVYVMNITVTSKSTSPVRYKQIIEYLKLLENNRRTAQVTNISITPDADDRNLFEFSITLDTYVRPA